MPALPPSAACGPARVPTRPVPSATVFLSRPGRPLAERRTAMTEPKDTSSFFRKVVKFVAGKDLTSAV